MKIKMNKTISSAKSMTKKMYSWWMINPKRRLNVCYLKHGFNNLLLFFAKSWCQKIICKYKSKTK